jgi:hypothetical protein
MIRRFRFLKRGARSTRQQGTGHCVMLVENPVLAKIKEIVGNGAVIETSPAPAIGSRVELHHPVGGIMVGNVVDRVKDGVRIAFNASDRVTRSALAAVAREAKLSNDNNA